MKNNKYKEIYSIEKDKLLSLFGSLPPKDGKEPKDWEVIRKEAKEEKFNSK